MSIEQTYQGCQYVLSRTTIANQRHPGAPQPFSHPDSLNLLLLFFLTVKHSYSKLLHHVGLHFVYITSS